MKRIGLIDNLNNIDHFVGDLYSKATAAEVMRATGGNTGNVAFVFGARKILKNPIVRVGWGWTPEIVRQRCDHLVVCCANQLGKHADLGTWADRLEQFNLPVTLLGLGAQSDSMTLTPEIPAGTLRFLEFCNRTAESQDAINIAVRGEYTQRVLAEIGITSEPAGCPSLHINSNPQLGAAILHRQGKHAIERVAVAAGNPWHAGSAGLERMLVEIVNQYKGDYILQHPESMLQVAYGEREVLSQKTIDRFTDVYQGLFDFEGMLDWYRRYSSVFVDAPNWMRFLGKFDTVIGPRYHGVALGLQAGIPGCVITIDSRTQELCQGTAIKCLPASDALGLSASELIEMSRWTNHDAEYFDHVRHQKATAYVSFLESNGLQSSDQLTQLAG
jgi:hypothetical protein